MRWRNVLFEAEIMRLMGMAVLVKPLGLVTQMLLASYFGAGVQYDAYVFTIFLVAFFEYTIGGVFRAVVVPLTIKLKATLNAKEIFKYQNAVYLIFILPVVFYMGIMVVRIDIVTNLIAPKLPLETHNYIAQMIKVMAGPGIRTFLPPVAC